MYPHRVHAPRFLYSFQIVALWNQSDHHHHHLLSVYGELAIKSRDSQLHKIDILLWDAVHMHVEKHPLLSTH